MVVRIWSLLVNYLFKYRRVRVYLRTGHVIQYARLAETDTPDSLAADWRSWMQVKDKIVVIREGRRVMHICMNDVVGVDVR